MIYAPTRRAVPEQERQQAPQWATALHLLDGSVANERPRGHIRDALPDNRQYQARASGRGDCRNREGRAARSSPAWHQFAQRTAGLKPAHHGSEYWAVDPSIHVLRLELYGNDIGCCVALIVVRRVVLVVGDLVKQEDLLGRGHVPYVILQLRHPFPVR